MNAVARTRALAAALGAVVLLAVGACSSADDDQASSSSSASSSPAAAVSTVQATAADSSADSSAATSSDAIEPEANTATDPAPVTTEAAATTEVPAPGGGDINQTVPVAPMSSAAPVALTDTSDNGNGVTVALSAVQAVTTTAELPGEIAGPGVQVTVLITNGSAAAADLGNVVVDLQDAHGTPAIPMSASPASPFTGSVAAGASASAVYVFTVPTDYANPATITVSYTTEAPVAVFVGDAK